jgi:chemotaxis response regulator CheB
MTVRALIVDDSPTIRGLLAAMLRRDPEIEVVGTAAEPLKARSLMRSLDPDVVTLDVEMPGMAARVAARQSASSRIPTSKSRAQPRPARFAA